VSPGIPSESVVGKKVLFTNSESLKPHFTRDSFDAVNEAYLRSPLILAMALKPESKKKLRPSYSANFPFANI
jgi:hypothetical protein